MCLQVWRDGIGTFPISTSTTLSIVRLASKLVLKFSSPIPTTPLFGATDPSPPRGKASDLEIRGLYRGANQDTPLFYITRGFAFFELTGSSLLSDESELTTNCSSPIKVGTRFTGDANIMLIWVWDPQIDIQTCSNEPFLLSTTIVVLPFLLSFALSVDPSLCPISSAFNFFRSFFLPMPTWPRFFKLLGIKNPARGFRRFLFSVFLVASKTRSSHYYNVVTRTTEEQLFCVGFCNRGPILLNLIVSSLFNIFEVPFCFYWLLYYRK